MNRPDFREIKNNKNMLLSRDRALKNLLEQESVLTEEAVAGLNSLREESAINTLRETPLSALNASKQGIRLSALSNAGFENIAELMNLSLTEIDSIKGIGTGSAETIKKTLDEIKDTVYENSSAKLTASSRTPAGLKTVKALYKLIHTADIRNAAAKLYSANHRRIADGTAEADTVKNRFFWFFSGQGKKEKTIEGAARLKSLIEGSFIADADRLLSDHQKAAAVTDDKAWNDFLSRPAWYTAAIEKVSRAGASPVDLEREEDRIRSDVPEELAELIDSYELKLEGLKTALRSYQTFGTKYALYQEKTLLGDEMGLGKTVQAIAAMVSLSNEGKRHFIVVCPASVLINWVREIRSFSPLEPLLIRDEKAAENTLSWSSSGGVAIVNYEALQKFLDLLSEDFISDLTVVDEAHYIKNPQAKRTVSASEVLSHSDRILLMSGTPLENRIDEMKNLIGLLNEDIAKKIRNTEDSWSGEGFRKKIAPVYLRRTREDVLTELPELIEKEEICPVTSPELSAYRQDLKAGDFMGMRQVSFKNVDPSDSSKVRRILELCDTAADQGRKVIIFSYFKNTLETVKASLGERCLEIINGSMPSSRRQEIIDRFTSEKEGAVLAAQIIAGGTGLNIQAASVVIICEPQIKPSLETQAISRAYRMGQLNSVLVLRMISDDTIDEDILKLLKNKQDIFDKFADGSEMAEAGQDKWIAGLISDQQKLFGEKEEKNVNISSNP